MWIWFSFNQKKAEVKRMSKKITKVNNDSDIKKVAEAIIKNAIKERPHDARFHGAVMIDGIQYISDGCVMMRLDKAIDLPEAKCEFRYDNILNPVIDSGVLENDNVVEFPSLVELKENCKRLKTEAKEIGIKSVPEHTLVYKYLDNYGLRIKYMMWAVGATGSTTAHINGKDRGGVLLQGNGVVFFILPAHLPKDIPFGFNRIG